MAELIDLNLVTHARKLVEELIERRGIVWFLDREGPRLMALDPEKIDVVGDAAAKARQRSKKSVPRSAVEHCRRQVRRLLIRRVALAMVRTGC